MARQRDVVEAEVPHGGIHHTVRGDREDGADDRASKAVVPVVEFVYGEGACNQARAENGGIDRDELPEGGVMVAEDLEFGVEVEKQIKKASKRGGAMTGWHRLE